MGNDNSTSSNRYWLCPLYSFDCDCESVDLAEGIQINPAPDALRKHIAERTYHLYGRWEDPSKFNWVASLPYREVASEGSKLDGLKRWFKEEDRLGDLLFDLVIALKLCHKGRVIAGPLMSAVINNSQWSFGGTTLWTRVSEKDFILEEPKYVLRQTDAPQVNELVKTLSKLRELEKLDSVIITIRRFHSSYHGSLEDRLIDQMIAFESLYLGYDQELKYRLALRAAFLLGRGERERKDIFSKMRKAYNLRSDIVHGNKPVNRQELKQIIPETEEYLRQSIQKFLSLSSEGHSLESLRQGTDKELAKLEENILSNGTLLATDNPSKKE